MIRPRPDQAAPSPAIPGVLPAVPLPRPALRSPATPSRHLALSSPCRGAACQGLPRLAMPHHAAYAPDQSAPSPPVPRGTACAPHPTPLPHRQSSAHHDRASPECASPRRTPPCHATPRRVSAPAVCACPAWADHSRPPPPEDCRPRLPTPRHALPEDTPRPPQPPHARTIPPSPGMPRTAPCRAIPRAARCRRESTPPRPARPTLTSPWPTQDDLAPGSPPRRATPGRSAPRPTAPIPVSDLCHAPARPYRVPPPPWCP
jgi:hypothetical protein